jgi:hypothetical protein
MTKLTNLPIQMFSILLAILSTGCQVDHKKALQSDQIYKFLQAEVGKVDKAISDLDKELMELEKPNADDEASLLTMKKAAFRKSMADLKKNRVILAQERTFLEMKLRTRAHTVISRAMRGDRIDGESELSAFLARYHSRVPARE